MNQLKDKEIILGITASIAAYKSCELVRILVKKGANVHVVMTKNACQFITPLTLQTLSGNRVASDGFDLEWESDIGHINLADRADLVVVAPATASFIGKVASAIADSLLANVLIATKAPIIICPAMNVNMYENTLVKENIDKLKKHGHMVMEPYEGSLACGWEGKGRLAEISDIVLEIEKKLTKQDLANKKILVTAGATREFIDPFRFISNPSTGKMGYAIAKAAWMRGADVTLISAYAEIPDPYGVNYINAESASDMFDKVMDDLSSFDIVIKAAGVSDYTPLRKEEQKIKKSAKNLTIKLKKTRDILNAIGKIKNRPIVVGFAAESENIVKNSGEKLKAKGVDLIVANNILENGAGFGGDTNIVHFIKPNGEVKSLPKMSKIDIGHKILEEIKALRVN